MQAPSNTWRNLILPGLLALAALVPAAGHAADLTVGAFGGIWEQSLRRCMIEPWSKATGKTVDVVLGTPTQWLNQIAASKGRPPLDVIYMPTENAYDAISRGLVDRFSPETVPNAQSLAPQFMALGDGYGTPHNYGGMGLIYNAQTITDPPKTWKEFVEGTIAGKWKASMPTVSYPSAGFTVSVWWMAKQFGGGVDAIEPGLAQVKKMQASGNISFWSDPNAVLNGLKGGDIDIALYWDGRAYAFIDDGNTEFKYYSPSPGVVVGLTWIQKVKGGSEAGYSFANFSLSKDAQSCFGSAIRYGVANKDAVFDPKIAHEITKAADIVFPPFKEIAPLQGRWLETWNKEVGR